MKLHTLSRFVHPSYQTRKFATTVTSKMDINTKYKMLSGYEIPALGYGVSLSDL